MDVALVTVGDELLAGDTENTNATWLARQITDRGGSVVRILSIPDDQAVIAEYVHEWADAFGAVVVTGGLGGTHDDVTMAAVADAFDRDLVVDPDAREDVEATARAFVEDNPDLAEAYDLELDFDAQASIPDGGVVLLNTVGLSPGCVIENVYVLPGIPDEMRAMFDQVADDFGGTSVSETLYTPAPEGALTDTLVAMRDRFDVVVGSYPRRRPDPNRVKITGNDPDEVAAAAKWLTERIDVVES